jgi:hypothetical protein
MRNLRDSFTKIHGLIALGLLVVFAALTLFACLDGSESDLRERHIASATLGAFSGPFTGALARPSQSSCWRCGWLLLPYCAGSLLAGFICQMIPLPFRRGASALRIGAWTFGLLGWFGGGTLSLLYAFS